MKRLVNNRNWMMLLQRRNHKMKKTQLKLRKPLRKETSKRPVKQKRKTWLKMPSRSNKKTQNKRNLTTLLKMRMLT